jgi:superfamily I DNA/RNA helicase
MIQLHYITGPAGTGKTRTLADGLAEWLNNNVLAEHQSVLAITRMHGARKRLHERLASKAIRTRLSVSTVDSFALELVNRWRLSLGYNLPIVPGVAGGFIKDELGYRATFDEIMKSAADLTTSPIVAKTVANSFPIILIDEFQDCTGNQLSFIKNLKEYVHLILAADPFQALEGDESACEWACGLEDQKSVKVLRLDGNKRTECPYLLEAADALVKNRRAIYSDKCLPFFFAPKYALAVWKVLFPRLKPYETSALIYPAHKSLIHLMNSARDQSEKAVAKGKKGISFPWHCQMSDPELETQTYTGLFEAIQQGTWKNDGRWRRLHELAQNISKVKGLTKPSETVLKYVVSSFIHARKFVTSRPIKFEATTIHGAKNREFNHVYVLWDNNLCKQINNENKRRWLYNAITRSKTSCTVIAIGSKKQVEACPVLSLLGEPENSFRNR